MSSTCTMLSVISLNESIDTRTLIRAGIMAQFRGDGTQSVISTDTQFSRVVCKCSCRITEYSTPLQPKVMLLSSHCPLEACSDALLLVKCE